MAEILATKKYGIVLAGNDAIDVMFIKEKGAVKKFALNYRSFIGNKWYEIYRVDNYHGFLHEQRFWRTSKPIPLKDEETQPLRAIMIKYLGEIKRNYQKYKSYFTNTKRGR